MTRPWYTGLPSVMPTPRQKQQRATTLEALSALVGDLVQQAAGGAVVLKDPAVTYLSLDVREAAEEVGYRVVRMERNGDGWDYVMEMDWRNV